MEKKYQIFISSTYEDLKTERKKVQDTILSMFQFPIGMEMFSAADEEQWEIIQETIDSSDYYVLIIGHRYGSVIEEGEYAGISYTQKEFRYALEKGIPILAFLIDNSVSITIDKIEQDSKKREKLDAFKNEVTTGRMVEWWTSAEDLANKVMNALNKQINRGKRPGWVRADKFDNDDIKQKLAEMSDIIRHLEEENKNLRNQIIAVKEKESVDTTQNTNVAMEQKSNFAKRLDKYIEVMNKERELYEEPITVGYICEILGEKSENVLRQFYVTAQEPDREFMEELAEKLGVNKVWLAKGADVPMFDVEKSRDGLNDILSEVSKSEAMYIAIGREGYGNCLSIILKYNDLKYKIYSQSFIFHVSAGARGQNQLMEVHEFLCKLKKEKNKYGKEIYPETGYFLSEQQWIELKQGSMCPAAIKNVKNYKSHIMVDFLDIANYYADKERYLRLYQEEFVECQEYIKDRLKNETRSYL